MKLLNIHNLILQPETTINNMISIIGSRVSNPIIECNNNELVIKLIDQLPSRSISSDHGIINVQNISEFNQEHIDAIESKNWRIEQV